jgi:hypothetical protein
VDPDRIDFSPLDVTQDELRYQRLVRGVMARTRRSVSAQVARVGPRVLAVAAGLAVLAWVPVLLRKDAPVTSPQAVASVDPASALADLAARGSASDAARWFVSGEVAVDE